MFFVFALLLLTSYAHANEMDATTLEGFQSKVYGTIMAHLDAEYQLLEPMLVEQNSSMENCRELIATAQDTCRSCASSKCQGDFGDWIMGGINGIGGWFEGAGNSFVDWQGWQDMGGFFVQVGNWFESAGMSFTNWQGFDDMASFFSGIGDAFASGFQSISNTLGNIGSSFGSDLGNIGNSIYKGLGNVFGRRRRHIRSLMMVRKLQTLRHRYMAKRTQELDAETRQCMEQCDQCTPFLGDQTALIGGVCGDKILVDQASLAEIMTNMQRLYTANGNPLQGTEPIISKIEFDQTDFSFTDFSMGGVYVTAITPNGRERYASQYRYKMQTPHTTADELAQELIDMWNIS